MSEGATLDPRPETTATALGDTERRWPVPQTAMLVTTLSIALWSLLAGAGVWLTG